MELLLKALIVEEGLKPPPIHDLRKLASKASLTMTTNDMELMDLLTAHILWAGKYPVPKGGEPEWDQHVDHMNSALTSRVPNVSIEMFQRNERLDRSDYTRLWTHAHDRYWTLYRQRQP